MKRLLAIVLAIMLLLGPVGPVMASTELVWETREVSNVLAINRISYHEQREQFVAVGLEGDILTSPNGEDWTKRVVEPRALNYDLLGIAHGNNTTVIVGSQRIMNPRAFKGIVLTSADKVSWTVQQIDLPYELRGVTYADDLGLFVAVGNEGWGKPMADGTRKGMTTPIIVTSRDGREWVKQEIPERRYGDLGWGDVLHDIVCGNGQLVAVGYPDVILVSRDAVNWEWQKAPTHDTSLRRIAYNDKTNTFVIVTWVQSGTAPILTSQDARSWIARRTPVDNRLFFDIVYGAGRFIAMGISGHLFISYNDGVSWDSRPTETLALSIGYGNERFVAFSNSPRGMAFAKVMAPITALTTLRLQIGSQDLTVERGGVRRAVRLDAVPEIPTGTARTFLPIRPVVEALGGQIFWNAEERQVTIQSNNREIVLWIGNPIAELNGVRTPIDQQEISAYIAPPGRTMLPLRFIAEALGAEVLWDGDIRTITITYPKP